MCEEYAAPHVLLCPAPQTQRARTRHDGAMRQPRQEPGRRGGQRNNIRLVASLERWVKEGGREAVAGREWACTHKHRNPAHTAACGVQSRLTFTAHQRGDEAARGGPVLGPQLDRGVAAARDEAQLIAAAHRAHLRASMAGSKASCVAVCGCARVRGSHAAGALVPSGGPCTATATHILLMAQQLAAQLVRGRGCVAVHLHCASSGCAVRGVRWRWCGCGAIWAARQEGACSAGLHAPQQPEHW